MVCRRLVWNISKYNFVMSQNRITEMTKNSERRKEVQHLVNHLTLIWQDLGQDQDGSAFHYDPARKLSAKLYDMYHCRVYSEKLLTMDRGTVRNM
jgi:hypothetical protein